MRMALHTVCTRSSETVYHTVKAPSDGHIAEAANGTGALFHARQWPHCQAFSRYFVARTRQVLVTHRFLCLNSTHTGFTPYSFKRSFFHALLSLLAE
jgi:hypothetical protein